MTLLEALTAYETAVWDALVSGDRAADEAMLADTFLGVYSDGFVDKSDHVSQLNDGPTIADFALSDLKVQTLGADHGVLSYRADFTRIGSVVPEVMYVSSIWERRKDGWINVCSQDTVAV